jgi:CTP:molybdopterin cytidylyltransferase MocA
MLAPVPPDGRPLLAHVVDVWRSAGLAEVVVVVGKDARFLQERIEENPLQIVQRETPASLAGSEPRGDASAPVRWVRNADWETGMFSSVKLGLAAALKGASTHVALSPADLPFLSRSSLRTLLDALALPEARGPRTVVVPVCGRRRGHPLVLTRELAERVLTWPEDARLNRVFAEPDVETVHLEGFDETVLLDVDRPADLAAARPGTA